MLLSNSFCEECIIINPNVNSKEGVIKLLCDKVSHRLSLDEKKQVGIYEAVIEREKKMSTGIGCHLAVPHAKVDFVEKMSIVAMLIHKDIEFYSIDNLPVHLVFLIISPKNVTGPHIKALSFISKMMADVDFRASLIASKTSKEFFELIKTGEESYI